MALAQPIEMYRAIVKPLLFRLPAERAHRLAFGLLRSVAALPGGRWLLRRIWGRSDARLSVQALGRRFATPVLLAAGFDKNAEGYRALGAIGFGGVEVGTITGHAQPGNPLPRLFRLPRDRALVNRMGFNNCGAELAARHLSGPRECTVGVNIGKTKRVEDVDAVADYVRSAALVGPLADYVVVNVSSPNTPGLRALQSVERLRPLLVAVRDELGRVAKGVPLLVKIAPDLADDEVEAVADLALELGIAGVIATNTTTAREGLSTPAADVAALGAGGLSGPPLKARALEVLRTLRARAGDRLTLIGAGGIETVDDAWERLAAGASLVQVYTAFVYAGPALPGDLARGLLARAREAGFDSLDDALRGLHASSSPGQRPGGP